MKNALLASLLLFSFAFSAQATVDVQTRVYIVSKDIQGEDDEFILERVPAQMCVGIFPLAMAQAIVQPVKIQTNYGCGAPTFEDDINAASCAKIDAEEVFTKDATGDKVRLKVDLSACGELKDNKGFKKTLRSAITRTFRSIKTEIVSLEIK